MTTAHPSSKNQNGRRRPHCLGIQKHKTSKAHKTNSKCLEITTTWKTANTDKKSNATISKYHRITWIVIPQGFEPWTHALEGRCSNPTELRNQTDCKSTDLFLNLQGLLYILAWYKQYCEQSLVLICLSHDREVLLRSIQNWNWRLLPRETGFSSLHPAFVSGIQWCGYSILFRCWSLRRQQNTCLDTEI